MGLEGEVQKHLQRRAQQQEEIGQAPLPSKDTRFKASAGSTRRDIRRTTAKERKRTAAANGGDEVPDTEPTQVTSLRPPTDLPQTIESLLLFSSCLACRPALL